MIPRRARPSHPAPNRRQGSGSTRPQRGLVGSAGPTHGGLSPNYRPGAPSSGRPSLGPPPAAAPVAAPPPPKPTDDASYNSDISIATRRGESELTALAGQERRTRFDFGIDDPTNPFSRMAGLKKFWLAKSRGESVGIAAKGHLYSGQHERGMKRVRYGEEQGRAQLKAAYADALRGIGDARTKSKFDTEAARNQAFKDWLARQQ